VIGASVSRQTPCPYLERREILASRLAQLELNLPPEKEYNQGRGKPGSPRAAAGQREKEDMQCATNSGAWMRQAAGLFLAMCLAGTCAAQTAAEKNNRVAAGDAAADGQRIPSHTSRPELPSIDGPVQTVQLETPQARQQRELKKLRMLKMKEQATHLADMARSLQEQIERSNENILSVDIVKETKKIENLARKIRNEARFGT
jgi:hypothetical protein